MKTIVIAILISLSCVCHLACADTLGANRIGAGLAIGTPTAVTGKYWTSNSNAIDFGIGFGWSSWTMFYGDYHWYIPQIFGASNKFTQGLSGYFGAGGGISIWSRRDNCSRFYCQSNETGTALLVRVPFGAEWYAGKPPFGVFLELVPNFTIVPGLIGSLDVQTGARYYF